MAHFAQVQDGVVRQVIVISNCDIGGCVGPGHPDYDDNPETHIGHGSSEFPDTESAGQAFIASLNLPGEWRQTSYSGSFRGKYAGQSDTYDEVLDEFVSPVAPEPIPDPEP